VTIPGLSDLLKDIKTLEDHAKAAHSIDEVETRVVRLTREEADVVESYRRFLAQDFD
jgi:histone deacetylase complex regulatory component SIN3